jgi:hypothetical protein
MQRLSARVVVVVVCLSLLALGMPVRSASSHSRQDYTFNCYGVSDGTVCAGITYAYGTAWYADMYYTSPDGYAEAYWQYGIGGTVSYIGAYSSMAGGTSRFPGEIEPAPQPPETLDCQQCIALQTRLCYNIWDAEYRQAGAEGAAIATSCLGLFALPPAMIICMGSGLGVGISGQRAANKRLDACLINGWRSCTDSQGRSCYQ